MENDTYTGLALSKGYFEACREQLEREIPDILAKAAVGLVGEGSECFGFDDQISQDHDWGPAFCLWLPKVLLQSEKARIEAAIAHLPDSFLGFPARMEPCRRIGRVGPLAIEDFYAGFGISVLPSSVWDWRQLEESSLAACTNGEVFLDNLGTFSSWRNALLSYYPEDVRRKKIASRCMLAAQSGQYNLVRSLQRSELGAVFLSAAVFAENMLSLVCLLHRQYVPFYKWACRKVASLPAPGPEVASLVSRFSEARWSDFTWGKETLRLIEQACADCAEAIRSQGLVKETGEWLWSVGADVQSSISDPQIRALNALKD